MARTSVKGSAGSALSSRGQVEADFAFFSGEGDGGDLSMKNAAASHDVGLHARLRAKDARQVFGLRAGDGGGSFVPMFGNPAAAGHGSFAGTFFISSVRRFAWDALFYPHKH